MESGLTGNEKMICVGVVAGAHGVRGLVRVKSFTAEPGDIAAYGPLWDERHGKSLRLQPTGEVRGQLLARVEGISDRSAAERLRGQRLYVPRSALPEPDADEYYHADLIGLRAELNSDGEHAARLLGIIRSVHEFGAGPVLEITDDDERTTMVPFTRDAVPEVDLEAGRVTVSRLPGLLEAVDGEASEYAAGGDAP